MNIERILRDAGGTKVRLGATEYHFKEIWPDGPHVAAVDDKAHQGVFLSIPEGYREYEGDIPKMTVSKASISLIAPPIPAAPVQPVQAPAPQQAQATASDEDGGAQDDGSDEDQSDDLEEMDDAALRALFKDEIGRAASPKSKPETMIAQIRAKREEASTESKD